MLDQVQFYTPLDFYCLRPALTIRTVIAFAYGFRFRRWPVIIADLQHTAVSAVVIAVPAVLRLAVFAVICHSVHPPENGYKKSASVQPLKAFSPEGETDAQGVFVFDFGNKKWAKRPSLTPSITSAI